MFDTAVARRLEALYRTADIRRRRALVTAALDLRGGERVADIGCGPGFVLADILDLVGPAGTVIGVDLAEDMIAICAERFAEHAHVRLHQGDALALPLPDATVDALSCVQVLEYVEDTATALAEMRRVLRPGGRLVVWDTDWASVSWHSSDPDRMQRILTRWDEHLTHPALPQVLGAQLGAAGFADIAAHGHAFVTLQPGPDSYVGPMTAMIAAFVAGRDGMSSAEVEAWQADLADLAARGTYYFCGTQVLFSARAPD